MSRRYLAKTVEAVGRHGGVWLGSPTSMSDPADAPGRRDWPPPPRLPQIERPPPEKVLDSVPSTDEVVESARSAAEIVDEQPSVDEIIGRDR